MKTTDIVSVDVIVIGAGMAGIGAARTLANIEKTKHEDQDIQSTPSVIVLEASNDIGGRVRSGRLYKNLSNVDESLDSFVTVGLGANWLHNLNGEINPIYDFAINLGMRIQDTSPDDYPGDDVVLYDNGQQVPLDEYNLARERYSWMQSKFEEYFNLDNGKTSLKNAFAQLLHASESVFGTPSDVQVHCINWFLERVAIDLASSLEDISTESYLEGESDGEYGEGLVYGGLSMIVDSLVEPISKSIVLNSAVVSISVDKVKSCVLVACSNGCVYSASVGCIITVPLGVLRYTNSPLEEIKFPSGVPRCISDLLRSNIYAGLMNVVWIWFPYSFWPANVNYLGCVDSTDFSTFLVPQILDSKGQEAAVLMCQCVGELGLRVQTMSHTEIAGLFTRRLRAMLANLEGVVVPEPVGCCCSAWGLEKYTRGSWSYFRADSRPDQAIDDVNMNLDESFDMYFSYAGEAASEEHRGTVHGAYLSGENEARKILQRLRLKLPL
jgi:polyamine oxidase